MLLADNHAFVEEVSKFLFGVFFGEREDGHGLCGSNVIERSECADNDTSK